MFFVLINDHRWFELFRVFYFSWSCSGEPRRVSWWRKWRKKRKRNVKWKVETERWMTWRNIRKNVVYIIILLFPLFSRLEITIYFILLQTSLAFFWFGIHIMNHEQFLCKKEECQEMLNIGYQSYWLDCVDRYLFFVDRKATQCYTWRKTWIHSNLSNSIVRSSSLFFLDFWITGVCVCY